MYCEKHDLNYDQVVFEHGCPVCQIAALESELAERLLDSVAREQYDELTAAIVYWTQEVHEEIRPDGNNGWQRGRPGLYGGWYKRGGGRTYTTVRAAILAPYRAYRAHLKTKGNTDDV